MENELIMRGEEPRSAIVNLCKGDASEPPPYTFLFFFFITLEPRVV